MLHFLNLKQTGCVSPKKTKVGNDYSPCLLFFRVWGMATVEEIARRLGGARKSGLDWCCRCPSHDDQKSSLSIAFKNGKMLVRCHAGCSQDEVISGLRDRGLWEDQKPREFKEPKVVDVYKYTDESGNALFETIRFEPKDFRQKGADGSWGIRGIKRVPYRLPRVLEAIKNNETVYIVEGEKDVHTAEKIGLTATCNPMGADSGDGNKWFREFANYFVGATCCIIPDNDPSGERHADWVISTLLNKAKHIKVATPSVGKDLTDWVESGATKEDIERASRSVFDGDEPLFVSVADLVTNLKPTQWLVKGVIPEEYLLQVFGSPASGKSFFAVSLACSVATGTPFFNKEVKHGPVFYIAGEGHQGLARRFAAWGKHHNVDLKSAKLFKSSKALQVLSQESVQEFTDFIDSVVDKTQEKPRLIVVDTLATCFSGGDENTAKDMGVFLNNLRSLSRKYNRCNILIVHHSGHGEKGRARGSSSLFANLDAEFEVTKDEGGVIQIKNTKFKDEELAADQFYRLEHVSLGTLENEEISSAVIVEETKSLNIEVGVDNEDNPISAREIVEFFSTGNGTIQSLADSLLVSKKIAHTLAKKVTRLGWLEKIDPANRKSGYRLTADGKRLLSHNGANLIPKEYGVTRPSFRQGSEPWRQRHRVDIDD